MIFDNQSESDNMEKQEVNLANLFQQLGSQSEQEDVPDFKLKDAVFSTIDATSLVADIVDLFTVKFIQSQSEVVDAVPESEFGFNEKEHLFKVLEKKFIESKQSEAVEQTPQNELNAAEKDNIFKFLEKKYKESKQSDTFDTEGE